MKKRILSAFMALALCLTLLPASALAEGEDVSISGGVIGGGETGGEGGGIYVAPGNPTEGGGGTYIPGEDTQTEIWCVSKPDSIGRGYDGTTDGGTIPIDLTFTDGTNEIKLKEGTGFTAKKTFDSADAGWHTVTVEIALIGEAAAKYKLKAGEGTFTIGGNINKAYPKLTVSLSQTTCTAGEKLLPLLSVEGAPEDAEVTYYYLASALKSWAGSSDVEGSEAMPEIDENTAISEPGTYYVYAKTGETTNYEEERSTTVELTVTEPVAASVIKADGADRGTYNSLPAALNAAQDGDTIKLLADLTAGGLTITKSVTLDLNGHAIAYIEVGLTDEDTGDVLTGNLTVADTSAEKTGKVTSKIELVVGNLTINGGTIGGTGRDDGITIKSGTLTVNGGTIVSLYGSADDSGTVTIAGGTVQKALFGSGFEIKVTGGSGHTGLWDVSEGKWNISGGEFEGVTFLTESPAEKAPISGGTFGKITRKNLKNGEEAFAPISGLLADGYAFYQKTDSGKYDRYVKLTDEITSLESVQVKGHTHEVVNGQCTACGATFAASVTQNGAVTYYEDFAKALDAWLENGGTLTLFDDYTATNGTWSIGSGSHTINLNSYRMSVRDDGAFKPTHNMHLTVTDDTERGQIDNILLDGSQGGSFTLESGYVGNLEMTGGAVVALKGGSVDNLDVQNCSANTNLSIQGGSIGKLNITDWADGMHVSATGGSLGAYKLPSGKILADVLDHQYYAEGTSLDRQVDTAQSGEKFVIKHAPYDFGSTSKAAEVPMNGSIPFMVDSPSENVGVYEVKWYRRTNSGAEHMTQNRVTGVKVGDTLDVFCVITGVDRPGGAMQWQVAVKGYTLQTLPPSLENAEIRFADGGQERTFWPDPTNHSVGKIEIPSGLDLYTVTLGGKTLTEGTDYRVISGNVATGIGTYDLTIEGIAPNYSGTKTAQWTVIPYQLHEPSFLGKQTYTKTYDGTTTLPEYTFRALFPSKGSDPEVDWREDKYKNNYEVTAAEFVSADVGENKPINQTITLKNENFVFAPTEIINIKGITTTDKTITYTNFTPIEAYPTLGTTFKIEKATMPDVDNAVTLKVINDHADTYTVDLAALLPKLESPKTYGEITYGRPAVWLDSGYYTAGNAKVENGKLILTINKNPVTTTGSIGTVTVKVSSTNYHDFTLTVNVNAANKSVSYSGDSNPTVKSETTTNPDGSVTKTETKMDGTVIETTTAKDGSVTRIETKPDGSSVTQRTLADGSAGTVKTDKNGKTEASVNISSKAAEEAKTTGNAVQIPAKVAASRDSNTAPTVKINLPTNAGETKVEIPVSNVNSGTVAVLVHPDGTEELVKSSIPTETGIQLTVTGSTTLKIIDNTKPFQDINGHWAENSIGFVGARELFMGTGTNTFSPDADMSRAQLWTVLARQENADLSGGSNWYEKSQLWAVDKGISDGTNPQDSISRAQMISMLWRTAGSPGTTDSPRFTDVPADAYYTDAVAWAVKNNITSGVGNGKFDPNAACTRAQIAVFLRNAYENDIF